MTAIRRGQSLERVKRILIVGSIGTNDVGADPRKTCFPIQVMQERNHHVGLPTNVKDRERDLWVDWTLGDHHHYNKERIGISRHHDRAIRSDTHIDTHTQERDPTTTRVYVVERTVAFNSDVLLLVLVEQAAMREPTQTCVGTVCCHFWCRNDMNGSSSKFHSRTLYQ